MRQLGILPCFDLVSFFKSISPHFSKSFAPFSQNLFVKTISKSFLRRTISKSFSSKTISKSFLRRTISKPFFRKTISKSEERFRNRSSEKWRFRFRNLKNDFEIVLQKDGESFSSSPKDPRKKSFFVIYEISRDI